MTGNLGISGMQSGIAGPTGPQGGGSGTGLTLATANVICYLDPAGNDSNAGTTALTPFKTLKRAFGYVSNFDYAQQFIYNINVANGTYPENNGSPWIVPDCKNIPLAGAAVQTTNAAPNVVFSSSWGFVHQGKYQLNLSCGTGGTGVTLNPISSAAIYQFSAGTAGGQQSGGEGAGFILGGNLVIDSTVVAGTLWNFLALAGGAVFDSNNFTLTFKGPGIFTFVRADSGAQANIDFNLVFPATTWTVGNAVVVTQQGSPKVIWLPTAVTNGSSVSGFMWATNGFPTLLTANGRASDGLGTTTFPGDPTNFWTGGGASSYNALTLTAPPTTSNASQGGPMGLLWAKDTTNGQRYLIANDSGTIYTKQIGRSINKQTGTSYTMTLSDQDGRVEMNNGGANTFTVPQDSAFATAAPPVGTEVRVVQTGAGATTIAAGASATVNGAGAVGGQWKSALLYKTAANTWNQTSV